MSSSLFGAVSGKETDSCTEDTLGAHTFYKLTNHDFGFTGAVLIRILLFWWLKKSFCYNGHPLPLMFFRE